MTREITHMKAFTRRWKAWESRPSHRADRADAELVDQYFNDSR